MRSVLKAAAIGVFAVPLFATPALASPALASPALASPAAPSAPAAPATAADGPCTGSAGVTVVVDETHFGAGVIRRCVSGDPDTAFDALTAAGVNPVHGTGQGQQGPYQYLCRIDSKPTQAQDPCTGFAANAPYWAYWVPDAQNANWAYADEGVDTSDPAPGTVLGFSFGAGTASDPNQMSVTLAQARTPSRRLS